MRLLPLVILLAYPCSIICSDILNDDENLIGDPDIHRNVSELITSKGYPVEEHIVQTEDGYLLSVQRIPYGKLNKQTENRKPVLIQHGVMKSSADFVINFPHQSLGFLLADSGYDVWLGNTRGGAYSRHHVNLDIESKEFWNFSFDEIAKYDLPAMIDYILNTTKEDNLVFIGHSQGNTLAFALLSEKPQYNKKIKLLIALAPVVEISNSKSWYANNVDYLEFLAGIMDLVGYNEFLPNSPAAQLYKRNMCLLKTSYICNFIWTTAARVDRKQYNETRTPVYAAHSPNGVSVKNVLHFTQMYKARKFQKFDYGKENWKYYNQDSPPEYDLSNVVTPTALFWGMGDILSDVEDVMLLENKLKSIVYSYCVPWKDFNHFDFIVGMNARQLVYDEIIALIERFKNNKTPLINGSFKRKTCEGIVV